MISNWEREVAERGRATMALRGYTWRYNGPAHAEQYIVTAPDGTDYAVRIARPIESDAAGGDYFVICECDWSGLGYNHQTCKHGEFVRDEAVWLTGDALREERRFWAELMQARQQEEAARLPLVNDARMEKMYAHPADAIEARLR